MKRRNIFLPLGFLSVAAAVLAHGLYTWNDRARALGPLAPIIYEGSGTHSKEIVKTLSSHKIPEPARKQFKDFAIAEDKKDPVGMRKVLTNMAETFKKEGETDMAVDLNKRAAIIGKSNGLHTEAGENLKSIGQIYHEAAKFDDASHNFKESAVQFREAKAWKQLDSLLVVWAKTEAKRGHNSQANKLKKQAEQITKKLKSQTNKRKKDIGVALNWDDPDDPKPVSKTVKTASPRKTANGSKTTTLDEKTADDEKTTPRESEPVDGDEKEKPKDDHSKEGEQHIESIKKETNDKSRGKSD